MRLNDAQFGNNFLRIMPEGATAIGGNSLAAVPSLYRTVNSNCCCRKIRISFEMVDNNWFHPICAVHSVASMRYLRKVYAVCEKCITQSRILYGVLVYCKQRGR